MAQSEKSEQIRQPTFTAVKTFRQEDPGNYLDGDVFIVQHEGKVQNAGVYTEGQIINLEGTVCKANVDRFTGGKKFAICRKNGGIPPSFQKNVDEAMNRCPEYDISKYICIEFVMELLEIYLKPTESDCMKIGRGVKPKGFRVIKRFCDDYCGSARTGELLLVERAIFGLNYHAGVCCGENGKEIIQFTIYPSSSATPNPCPGVVSKVHMNGFSTGKKFAIYRKKTGIPPSFQETVDEAMTKTPKYDNSKYNCVHFALELLYGELEKNERDVKSLTQLVFGDLE